MFFLFRQGKGFEVSDLFFPPILLSSHSVLAVILSLNELHMIHWQSLFVLVYLLRIISL